MKKWLFAVLVGSALVLGACGGSDDGGETSPAETVYKKNCASCHGQDLEGGMGPGLATIGSDYSAEEIDEIIREGKGDMPAQPKVDDDDREMLAEWLAAKK